MPLSTICKMKLKITGFTLLIQLVLFLSLLIRVKVLSTMPGSG